MSDPQGPHALQPSRLLSPWDFPGRSTGVGCHFLLQGIFPTQGSNPGLPRCRQTLYPLSHYQCLIKNTAQGPPNGRGVWSGEGRWDGNSRGL